MKIRLVIPECEEFLGYCCKTSLDIDQRLEMLKVAMEDSYNVDLIVTSHNYFAFNHSLGTKNFDAKKFIINKIVPMLCKYMENIKPLVIGFDMLNPKSNYSKNQRSKGKNKESFNPYNGIDSIVCYIKVVKKSYAYHTHIWECWQSKDECNSDCFKKQNTNRIFSLDKKKLGLLSCGDIAGYCHDNGNLLPKADVYLDLSHKSLTGRTSQYWIPSKMINDWEKTDYVLVTHQVKDVSKYLKDKEYRFIFPQGVSYNVKKLSLKAERKGVLIDIDL